MAGDWIKIEHATPMKPELLTIAEFLGISRRESLGLFVDYCIWLDQNLDESRNGLVTQVSRKSLEETLQCSGFAALLEKVKWAYFDDEARTMTVLHWEFHNGNTAKTRAQTQKRAKRFRNAARNDDVTQTALPEKRRVIKKYIRKCALPTDFCISDQVRSWAAEKGHGQLEQHLASFVGKAKANGYKYADWDQAFMNAIRDNWAKIEPPQPKRVAL